MQDMIVVLTNKRIVIFAADENTMVKEAEKVAKKFGSEISEILIPPLRREMPDKVCGFLENGKCLVMEDYCPFINRIMSQCKSFTERD